jgi:carbamoyltransferase
MSGKHDLFILGISATPHNGAVCLLKGDEIVIAIQEERLTRNKRAPLFGAYPSRALEYCLKYAEIQPKDLSMVVCCVTNHAKTPQQDISLNPILQITRYNIPTLYIPHHYGHAVSAFVTSGFQESAVLVIDGAGSPQEDLTEEERLAIKWKCQLEGGLESISLYTASGTSVKPLEKHMIEYPSWIGAERDGMPTFWSLGAMYSAVAYQIFGSLLEAGKVMGLAPYGRPEITADEFFTIDDGRFVFYDKVPNRFRHTDRWPLRQKEYSDLASSTQSALEEAVLYLTERLYDLCPSKALCYAGGVALNCITNERIIRESSFKNIYITPAAEDSGTAIGAAYHGLWQFTKVNSRKRLLHDAVGPVYSEQQIRDAIRYKPAVEIVDSEDVISNVADLICEGNIVGWFEGRSELGPRALGQRSILCDPRRPDVKEILNSRIKFREAFRPFAPVVLIEHAKDWFDLDGTTTESPFMLRVCKFNEGKKNLVPGVVHIDNTGRVQTVTSETNGRLYLLLKKFYEKTGIPIILNTSFNVAGEPIVETPSDALDTFLSTGIDYCFLENVIVSKRKEILFERDDIPWPQRIKNQITDILNSAEIENRCETPERMIIANPEQSLEDYIGNFYHEAYGGLKIDREGHQLKATLIGPLGGSLSVPLRRCHSGVFETTVESFPKGKIVFLPDIRERTNLLAVVAPEFGLRNVVYFRKPTADDINHKSYWRFIGEYRSSDKKMVVALRDDKLVVSIPGRHGFELIPSKGTEFILYNLPGYSVEFKSNASGVTTGAIVTQPKSVVFLEKH